MNEQDRVALVGALDRLTAALEKKRTGDRVADILTLQREVHQNSVNHGFWEASADIPTKLMLIVSELSEALEDYRDDKMEVSYTHEQNPKVASMEYGDWGAMRLEDADGNPVSPAEFFVRKPEGFPVELADVVIRVMDLAGYLGIDLGAVVELKMAYNATRPHLHGRRI